MLRRLHRKLQLIRYYSATRRTTVWTRATDAALIVTLLAAYPVVWMLDAVVAHSVETRSVSGMLATDESGDYRACTGDDVTWLVENPRLSQAGRFTLTVEERRHGWPLATSIGRRPARLDLDVLSRPQPQPNATLAPGDPIRSAIETELARVERTELLASWAPGTDTERSERWLVVAVSGLMWWVMLFLAASVAIQTARLAHSSHRRRAEQRQSRLMRTGRCAGCGYDLRGLEFNERCPECGELV